MGFASRAVSAVSTQGLLAATEAFANAIEHPHAPTSRLIEVDGSFADGVLALTLRDSGSWGDHRQREEGGYGFPLMRRLVDAVEIDTGSHGTAVTLHRRLGSRPPRTGQASRGASA